MDNLNPTKDSQHRESVSPLFLQPYDPKAHEDRIYDLWIRSGYFNPDNCIKDGITAKDAPTFSIVLPPPNVTGVLHLGHAYEDSLQDAMVRYHRMSGKRTLWIPGTDSAAISTQARVEKNLQKDENKSKHDLGREEFVRRVYAFAKESENTILSQVKKMGASLDWSRYAFALDPHRTRAVTTAFVRMYKAGLIYRGERIVNWDPKGQTTISDDEIVYREEKAKFYYFKYGPFTIGTARPETKFGDKYIVVHPDDPRYKAYTHGDTFECEWINGTITATVIKDEASDPEMGSGAMTITPSHSLVDFEIAERHNLPHEQVIDRYGKLRDIAGEFSGMKIIDAREKIVEKLKQKGLLVNIDENYIHNVPTAERTGAVIEPQIMEQWFVDVDKEFTMAHSKIAGIASGDSLSLKEMMRRAVEGGSIEMPQERFRKTYLNWITNLHDWCISRQIWFGHRIPVWYKDGEVYCDEKAPSGEGWVQDSDVLDTWFSSALWTFSTLGWPEQTEDLATYHPTSFMSPAYEILPLWVSRMILMSGFHLGEVPFHTVFIHGLVRDNKGQKFSKSLGNGKDPVEVIHQEGADALRMGLLAGTAIGNDIKFDENKIRGYKKFSNKLWNITRFILSNRSDQTRPSLTFSADDTAILNTLYLLIKDVTRDMEKFSIYLAIEKIYHYVWHELADIVLEASKPILSGDDLNARHAREKVLEECLIASLKLLHPFMPFVTETIWQELPREMKGMESLLMVASWPHSAKKEFD